MQELTTDNAICAWDDTYLQPLHNLNIVSNNVYVAAMYDRSFFQITVANDFIRQSTDAVPPGVSPARTRTISALPGRSEFLRAYQYYADGPVRQPGLRDGERPRRRLYPQTDQKRADLFSISNRSWLPTNLADAPQNEYARVDQAAEWALLARMYLNADTYLGSGNDHYTDAITYAGKVINAGYSLMPNFSNLFNQRQQHQQYRGHPAHTL
jgi:hypothetical protein